MSSMIMSCVTPRLRPRHTLWIGLLVPIPIPIPVPTRQISSLGKRPAHLLFLIGHHFPFSCLPFSDCSAHAFDDGPPKSEGLRDVFERIAGPPYPLDDYRTVIQQSAEEVLVYLYPFDPGQVHFPSVPGHESCFD